MGRSAAPRLEQALTALGIDHDVKVYPGAGHGFINDPDPADATPLLIFLAKISGTRYHDPSAADARRRIAGFSTSTSGTEGQPAPAARRQPRSRAARLCPKAGLSGLWSRVYSVSCTAEWYREARLAHSA